MNMFLQSYTIPPRLSGDAAKRAAVQAALPDGWTIASDRPYCGSELCRAIEAHREHGEGPHFGCYVTGYGPYDDSHFPVTEHLLRQIAARQRGE